MGGATEGFFENQKQMPGRHLTEEAVSGWDGKRKSREADGRVSALTYGYY
ncbi:MAG: hypothetical protein GY751_12425 [Bacteroidetes bacterium]|nr:hypothetical protein [Bacteroidota bacterium]